MRACAGGGNAFDIVENGVEMVEQEWALLQCSDGRSQCDVAATVERSGGGQGLCEVCGSSGAAGGDVTWRVLRLAAR